MTSLTGVLLVNLGTPFSPRPRHVFRYLIEFLTDGRVIDSPWWKRQLLVRSLVVPLRFRQSAKLYKKLWKEEGAPLLIYGREVEKQLQQALGSSFKVVLAMRYQSPSISEGLESLKKEKLRQMIILPLFPQYASATTGSVHQTVMEYVSRWEVIPKTTFINSYPTQKELIQSYCEIGLKYQPESFDHILMSFHGLPERQVLKSGCDPKCFREACCPEWRGENHHCYRAQCYATAAAIGKGIGLQKNRYTVCFQSRLGREPWLQPYTLDIIRECAQKGMKRLLVFCPAFVCDCLETTIEISMEYAHEFKKLGGETLQLVEGLNSHPTWIKALRSLVLQENIT